MNSWKFWHTKNPRYIKAIDSYIFFFLTNCDETLYEQQNNSPKRTLKSESMIVRLFESELSICDYEFVRVWVFHSLRFQCLPFSLFNVQFVWCSCLLLLFQIMMISVFVASFFSRSPFEFLRLHEIIRRMKWKWIGKNISDFRHLININSVTYWWYKHENRSLIKLEFGMKNKVRWTHTCHLSTAISKSDCWNEVHLAILFFQYSNHQIFFYSGFAWRRITK